MTAADNLQPRQFYHGTTHHFSTGDLIGTHHEGSRYPESSKDHVYFSSDPHVAAQYAGMRDNPQPEHNNDDRYSVYKVVPTGSYESDPRHLGTTEGYDREPNYQSKRPLRVVGRMKYTHQQIRDAEV